jgi:hypothetical protein
MNLPSNIKMHKSSSIYMFMYICMNLVMQTNSLINRTKTYLYLYLSLILTHGRDQETGKKDRNIRNKLYGYMDKGIDQGRGICGCICHVLGRAYSRVGGCLYLICHQFSPRTRESYPPNQSSSISDHLSTSSTSLIPRLLDMTIDKALLWMTHCRRPLGDLESTPRPAIRVLRTQGGVGGRLKIYDNFFQIFQFFGLVIKYRPLDMDDKLPTINEIRVCQNL